MTDSRMSDAGTLSIIAGLDRHTGVVFRHYGHHRRAALAHCVAALCKRRRLCLLVAADENLAQQVGADGVHWPAGLVRPRRHWKPRLYTTAAAHNRADIIAARRMKADTVFVSPVFSTRSHVGAATLGVVRFGLMQRGTSIKAMALGGINSVTLKQFKAMKLAGYAAIDGFADSSL